MSLETRDMFDGYPNGPGWKVEGTSRQAAGNIRGRAQALRVAILALLKTEAMTADDAAKRLGEECWSVRPRFSELRAKTLIYDTGARGTNASGADAIIWRAR